MYLRESKQRRADGSVVTYPTAWLIQHKLMQVMAEREECYVLEGKVQVDDVYLGGERTGGKVGRGSENKVIAAVGCARNPGARFSWLTFIANQVVFFFVFWQHGFHPGTRSGVALQIWSRRRNSWADFLLLNRFCR